MKSLSKIVFSCVFIFSIFSTVNAFADSDTLVLKGNVGGYAIEMEISSSDYATGEFQGRYRYLSQTSYLDIKGQNFGTCMYIEEFYDEDQTGSFYLDFAEDSLKGWWVAGDKSYTVELSIAAGNHEHLLTQSLEELSSQTNDSISGTYQVDYYYISDYFATEVNPVYEIGYNGGYVSIEEVGQDTLKFEFEFLCGPTYHIASAEGVAVKTGDIYVYSEKLWDEESCEVTFMFSEKGVYVSSVSSFSCGFGARAYVDHELIKVNDYEKE